MYKNWPAISRVENGLLKQLCVTATEETIIAGLARGFPELFSEQRVRLTVPASRIRARARERSIQFWGHDEFADQDAELAWFFALPEFGIPVLSWEQEYRGIPRDILRQLVGQRLAGGMKVRYASMEWLVVALTGDVGGLKTIIEVVPDAQTISLTPAEFIDLNA